MRANSCKERRRGSSSLLVRYWACRASGNEIYPSAMTYVSVEYYENICPRCGHSYFSSVTGKRILLGPGWRSCTHCEHVFNDGSREWLKLKRAEKLRYWFPAEVFICLALGLIIGSAVFPLIGGYALLVPIAFTCLILGPFFIVQFRKRSRSLERTRIQQEQADFNHWLSEQAAEYWKNKKK